MVQFLMNGGYRLFAEVAQRYRTPSDVTAQNLQHNKVIDHANREKNLVGRGIFINGQGKKGYNNYHLSGEQNYNNGCVPIGIYNSLVALDGYESIPSIQQWLEKNRYIARPKKKKRPDGSVNYIWRGSVTIGVESFFKKRGYRVRTVYLPRQKRLETAIRQSNACLLCVKNKNAGSHCITASFDAQTGEYVLYNRYENIPNELRFRDLGDLYGTSASFVLVAHPICQPKTAVGESI